MRNAIRGAAFRRPILFVSSLFTLALVAVLGVATAYAVCIPTAYSVTASAPPAFANWTTTVGVWQPAGGFPGCAPGDSASDTNASPTTLFINSTIPNPIIGLNLNCIGCSIQIQSGGSLTLAGAGSISSGSSIVVQPGGALTLANGATLTMQSGSVFDVGGGFVDVQSGGLLKLQTSSAVTSSGTLQLSGGEVQIDPGLDVTLSNGGTVQVNGGGTLSGGGRITGSGSIDVNSGTLTLKDGIGDVAFNIAAGASADSAAGTYTLTTNGTVSGAGTLGVSGGTLSIGGVTSPGGFSMTAGTLTGVGFLDTDTLNWSGGTITGSGGTQLNGSGTGTIDGSVSGMTLDGRNFNNYGYINFTATTNPLTIDNGATFSVYGTMVLQDDGTINAGSGGGNFAVAPNGLLWKANGSGSSTISAAFANSASVQATSGELVISGDGTSSGSFYVGSGAELEFAASSTSLTGSVNGDGTVSFSGSTTYNGYSFSVHDTEIYGGTLTMFASGETTDMMFDGGTLGIAANQTFTLNGTGDWSSGTINGSGVFYVASGATFTINASTGDAFIGGIEFKNDGTVNYTGVAPNQITMSSALITNNGLFDIQTDQPITEFFFVGDAKTKPGKTGSDGLVSFGSNIQNNGTFQKSAGTGSTVIDPDFANAGTVKAQSGEMHFTGSYTQTAGTTTLGAGNIKVDSTMQLTGGELNGMGTITGDVQNDAKVAPGSPACTITITGNYTQGSGGELAVDLDSASLYDVLAVGGAATLDGKFTASLNYTPVVGTQFTVLTFGTRVGDFTTYVLPSMIASSYTSNALVLTAVAPVTDLAAFMNGPATVSATAPLSYDVIIQNNGPDTTGGTTTVVDTLPTGVTGASGSGTGWSCGAPSGGTITCTSTDAIASTLSYPTLTISTTAPTASGSITNSATVSSPFDGNSSNNSASVTTTVNGVADLQVVKSGPAGVVAGQNVVYTVTVTNNGPSTVNGVVVFDTTPANLSFVSNSGDCATPYPCTLNTLTAGQVKVITSTYSTSPSFSGNVTNTAGVAWAAPTTDPDNSNNSSSATTNVGAQADLAVSKTGPASAIPGQDVTYTITVTNNGPSPATNVIVSDPTPAGVAFSQNTGACVTAYPCNVGTLAAGQSATINSTYSIPANYTGATVVNTASASSSINDPNTADNSSTATTNVTQQADLSIVKSGPPSASPGGLVTYTVTVTNLGPSTASSIVVNDATPAGLTFAGNSGACATPYPCNLAAPLASGQSATITTMYSIPANYAGTSITNTASVSSAATDSNLANNSSSVTTPVTASADLSIVKSGPASYNPGSNVMYTITVTNNGPLSAANVFVTDPTPVGLGFVSNSGACAGNYPCALGTMTAGQTKTITTTFSVPANYSGSITNTASVSSSTNDGNGTNDASTVVTPQATSGSVDLLIVKSGFPTAEPSSLVTFQIAINNNSAVPATGVTVNDATPSGLTFVSNAGDCTTPFPCAIASIAPNQTKYIQATYFVQAASGNITNTATVTSAASDPNPSNNSSSFTFSIQTPPLCPAFGPQLIAPADHATVTSPVTLSWSAVLNATQYVVTLNGGGPPRTITTGSTSTTIDLENGTYNWSVDAIAGNGCPGQSSAHAVFSVCTAPTEAPSAGIPGQMTTGQNYTLEWTAVTGAATYEVQEASDETFANATSSTAGGLQKTFSKNVFTPTAFFYRVRAVTNCNAVGPFSPPAGVVVVPVPAPNTPSPSVNVPLGSTKPVTFQLFIPGIPGITTSFFVTTDKPWISITPITGIVGPEGTNVTISLDASHLDNGTWTGTVIVVYGTAGVSSRVHTDGSSPTTSIPVSVNVVTPVSPQPLTGASQSALVVPSLGFLASGGSTWRSDIRLANIGSALVKYQLSFNNGSSSMKQTFINIEPGATTALDDFVRNWFGVGPLGDSSNGALTIQALDSNGKPVAKNLATIVSSRTFNAIGTSTLGQFIPATPFTNFIGKAASGPASILTLQQIAQSSLYRTNLGLVEGANKSANVIVSVFNGAGSKLLDIPTSLKAGEQKQLNSFLLANGITLDNGHVEVQVTGGDGRVTAYASVIDNQSQDPFFMAGVPLGTTTANHFVVPGVAEVEGESANWRSDLRVLNGGNAPQTATLTFVPSNATSSVSQQITLNPGEVKAFDNVLQSTFGLTNTGGVLHVTTINNAPLVVTARTYDQTSHGSVGQFIPAITPAESVGAGDRALQVLQLEESPRYRTNVGIAEVTGFPAVAEISVVLPDSKVSPIVRVPLGAYEFVQLPVLSNIGVGNVYNTRISVRVIDGGGKVTAYGSVIDRNTLDATYVPAQ
jgi:uncharacterized repeat protein (TIGR01451 family)